MNKRIITLQGKSDTGKTETLKILIDKLSKIYPVTIFKKIHDKKSEDLVVEVELKDKKLGITTRGDSRYYLERDFRKLGDCDLYVCASRTKGATIDFLDEQTNSGILSVKSLRDSFNEKQADEIFDEIMAII